MVGRHNLAGKEILNPIFQRTRIGEITAPMGELIPSLFLNFYLGSGTRFSLHSSYSIVPIIPLKLEVRVYLAVQPKFVLVLEIAYQADQRFAELP
jgi:hypothetical protein